jgi:Ni/Fe-hydrogenase 1 B-type cytochrome subunit
MATTETPPRGRRRLGQVTSTRHARRAIYVWELPIRIVHWTVVGTLLVLSFTGYYIHHPFLRHTGSPASGQGDNLMGLMRFIHIVAAFVFTAAVIGRLYWFFAGNRYAHWRAYVPATPIQRRNFKAILRYYALVRRHPPRLNGHNPLAGVAYMVLYFGFLLMILTGFAMWGWLYDTAPWNWMFGWVNSLLGVANVRLIHFLLMFAFIAFFVHHLYSVMLFDYEERNGELSSIVTGWKDDLTDGAPERDTGDWSTEPARRENPPT